jgi:hypothetical protein
MTRQRHNPAPDSAGATVLLAGMIVVFILLCLIF